LGNLHIAMFSFWDHKLLLINDRSVRTAKKFISSLPVVIVGLDIIFSYYYLRTITGFGMRIRSFWETCIILSILILGS
jgi:hypothetical protein